VKDHDHDWSVPGTALELTFTIDFWQGPTDAIVQCGQCGDFALLRLLHWSDRNLSKRIFVVAALPEAAVGIFLRNMRSDYCDLSRHKAEVDSLLATAESPSGVIEADVPGLEVIACHGTEVMQGRPVKSWRDVAPDESDPHWLELIDSHT